MAAKRKADLEVSNADLFGTGIPADFEGEIINGLKQMEGITDFLRMTMAEDMKRHFNAQSPMEQLMAKGAFFRMKYLLKKIQEAKATRKRITKTAKSRDLDGVRYE